MKAHNNDASECDVVYIMYAGTPGYSKPKRNVIYLWKSGSVTCALGSGQQGVTKCI